MRTGDVVKHKPSGEEWVVAWADLRNDDMAPCGWPECMARASDCEIVKKATDEECDSLIDQIATSGRRDAFRARKIQEQTDGE